jgi:hypothetical protein
VRKTEEKVWIRVLERNSEEAPWREVLERGLGERSWREVLRGAMERRPRGVLCHYFERALNSGGGLLRRSEERKYSVTSMGLDSRKNQLRRPQF